MSWHKALSKRYAGRPMLLLVAAAGFTFSLFGFYRYAYKPWSRRNKMNEAQAHADYLFTTENQKKSV